MLKELLHKTQQEALLELMKKKRRNKRMKRKKMMMKIKLVSNLRQRQPTISKRA